MKNDKQHDEYCRMQAMKFISDYQRITGCNRKQALTFAATDDCGPIIWHGIDLLRQQFGMSPLRERNPDT